MPFGADVAAGREGRFEVVCGEEARDDGVEDEGAQRLDRRTGLRDDEVDVARVRGAAPVGAPDCEFHGRVRLVAGVADEFGVALDFPAGDARREVVDVGDADALVFREGGFGEEVGECAVALVDPLRGLRGADAVDP